MSRVDRGGERGDSGGDGRPLDTGADEPTSVLFTYVAPFVGVLLIAVGIAGAVPGGYALIQDELRDCGSPTIAVETPERSAAITGDGGPELDRFSVEELGAAEAAAFEEALADPRREAHVDGPFPHRAAFESGVVITYEGEQYYATVVAENTCFTAPALGFPLGVFAIGLGTVGVLTPPLYRKLAELERRSTAGGGTVVPAAVEADTDGAGAGDGTNGPSDAGEAVDPNESRERH
ncbi:hypothetical protein [Halobaculum limi]|uniref:hypothetical protein n=1 Tax=Halobaculum limi TaxID=3031916 RepID=UPI002404F720|nr:hypothetical protein [Halobaculum sp. YSMS11]